MLVATEDGRKVLCVDELAGDVRSAGEPLGGGEIFFDAEGRLAASVQKALEFLSLIEESRAVTQQACTALEKHGLIVPWTITLQTETGIRKAEGLFRVDEVTMNALPAEAFLEIRQAGALPIAYAQLLSMQHLQYLADLARSRAEALQRPVMPVTPSGDLDLSFLERGDTLRFS